VPEPCYPAQIALARRVYRERARNRSRRRAAQGVQSPDAPVPHGYATELHLDLEPGDSIYDQARNEAYLVGSAVVGELAARLWD